MNPSNTVHVMMITYISFAFVFFVIKARMAATGMKHMMAILTFVVLSGMLQFIVNLQLSQKHCGGVDMKSVVLSTLLPWVFIFCGFTLALNTLPGWLRVFSNTFGMFVLKESGLTTLVNALFEDHPLDSDKIRRDMLGQIYTNQTALIMELDLENVVEKEGKVDFPALQELVRLKLIQPLTEGREPLIQQLYHKLLLKNEIGYFCWYLLIGIFFILVSTNSLLSSGCGPKKR
jgi:hypothetical protein